MKKLLFVILLILVSGYAFCIDVIDFRMVAEFGLIPGGQLAQYNTNQDVYPKMSFYGDFYFETQLVNNIIFLGIDTKVYIWKTKEGYTFRPDYIHFMFTAGLRYKFAEIGFRHYCEHPIIAWINNNYGSSNWERWYQEIYVKLEFQTK